MSKPNIALTLEEIKELCKIPENEAFFRKNYPELFEIKPVHDIITLKSCIEDLKFNYYILNPDFVWSVKEESLQKGATQQVLVVQTKEPHF